MKLAIYNNAQDRAVRVQRKSKRGQFGIYMDFVTVPVRASVQVEGETGNRFKLWFIDANQSLYPGTRHIKFNIGGGPFPQYIPEIVVSVSSWDIWPELVFRDRSTSKNMGNNNTIGKT